MKTLARRGLTILLALVFLFLLLLLFTRFGPGWFLASGRFQRHMAAAVGDALDAHGSFEGLHYNDEVFSADGYKAQGKRGSFFAQLQARQIRAAVNWHGLLDHRWQIDDLAIDKLSVDFQKPHAPVTNAHPPAKPKSLAKWRIDLRHAEVTDSTWRWGATPAIAGSITHSAFTLQPNNDDWLLLARGGTFAQSGWPSLTIESARLRCTSATVLVDQAVLRRGDGRIELAGEAHPNSALDLQAHFERIPATPFLSPAWQLRLHGHLAGQAKIHAPLAAGSALAISGELHLSDGELEAMPLLDDLARIAHIDRLRRLSLTRGSLFFSRNEDRTTVKNLVLESQGVLRLEGDSTLVNGEIEGHFQLGLSADILKALPGLQARVFTVAHDGYYWTPVRVTGPVAHPREDLSERLETAAAEELLKKSRDLLKKKAKRLLEGLPR